MSEKFNNPGEIGKQWMPDALAEAAQAENGGDVPVGAVVIAANGLIVGRGFNRREQDEDPCAHAEVVAIREAARTTGHWRLTGCSLVVTLEPCPMCLAACQAARVERVVYGAEDPKGGAISLGYKLHEDPRTNHRFEATLVPDPRCSQVLKDFFKKRRSENT
jgi:tRNA(adenine34) deaminase